MRRVLHWGWISITTAPLPLQMVETEGHKLHDGRKIEDKIKQRRAVHNGLPLLLGFPWVTVGSKMVLGMQHQGSPAAATIKSLHGHNPAHFKQWRERSDRAKVWGRLGTPLRWLGAGARAITFFHQLIPLITRYCNSHVLPIIHFHILKLHILEHHLLLFTSSFRANDS